MYKSTTKESQEQIPEITQSLDELAREGARRMILAALELEVEQYLEKLRHLRDEDGYALVVRNGKAEPRTVSLGAGSIKFQAPRVDDRRPEHRFTSKTAKRAAIYATLTTIERSVAGTVPSRPVHGGL
jgi:hypothetical protein